MRTPTRVWEKKSIAGRRYLAPPSGIPIEAQIKEPLEIAVHHGDLRAGELLKVCGGTGVIDMGVRAEQQPDVLGLVSGRRARQA